MPLFGKGNQNASPMRPNETVMANWKTHQGDLQLTNQRCLLLKGGGLMGGHPELHWQVDLENIQNMQVVGSGNTATSVAQGAATNVASSQSPIGNPFSGLSASGGSQLIIDGMAIHFHESNHANAAQSQIESAKQARLHQLGRA